MRTTNLKEVVREKYAQAALPRHIRRWQSLLPSVPEGSSDPSS